MKVEVQQHLTRAGNADGPQVVAVRVEYEECALACLRLLADALRADPTLRVDEEIAVHRLIVEIDTAIGFKNLELSIRKQRESNGAFFLRIGRQFLELLGRVGADGDQIDPAVCKVAGL